MREVNDLSYLSRLFRIFDIVHVHAPTFYSFPSMYEKLGLAGWGAAAHLTRRPVVWTFHGHLGLLTKYLKAVQNEMRYADIRTAVNIRVARQLGIDHVPNGVNCSKFKPLDEEIRMELRSKFGLPRNRLIILAVGRWIPRKGQDILADYLSSLYEWIKTRICVLFIGPQDPGYVDYYRSVIDKLRSAQINFITRSVASRVISLYYAISDVFILTSRDEGDPLVLLEAMSCGLPCITSEVGSERIQHGRNGFIVSKKEEFIDCLEQIIRDEELRKRLGKAARLTIQKYDWSYIAEMYEGLYREAITRRRGV